MTRRLETLVLDANGFGWKAHAADTVLLGLLRRQEYPALGAHLGRMRILRMLKSRYDALSYVRDWRDAICASPALSTRVCNITNLADLAVCLLRIRRFDLVVVLHSAAGDSMSLMLRSAERLRKRSGKLVVFIGNEYDLMAEKLDFLRASGADYVCSQLPIESARWLYGLCGAEVVSMPHALNPRLYRPDTSVGRDIDIGFIGALYCSFIGDIERTRLIRRVESKGSLWGLACDIRKGTIPRGEWADFLRRCRGTVGGESGTYYLDRRGDLVASAKAYLARHPQALFEEVHERFFAHPAIEHVSGKCISSRHFEPAGTKTCQILLEGSYNGILEPEKHYIGVRKDLVDLDDAIDRFKDDAYRDEITSHAYEHVLQSHTYAHRVRDLVKIVGG